MIAPVFHVPKGHIAFRRNISRPQDISRFIRNISRPVRDNYFGDISLLRCDIFAYRKCDIMLTHCDMRFAREIRVVVGADPYRLLILNS